MSSGTGRGQRNRLEYRHRVGPKPHPVSNSDGRQAMRTGKRVERSWGAGAVEVAGRFALTCLAILGPAAVAGAGGVTARPVSFVAPDGQRIAADYYAPPPAEKGDAPMVILLHMYRSDRAAWAPLVGPLHEAGFAVLALDLRGHGESATTATRDKVEQRDPQVFREMQNDVLAAYDWLAAQPGVDRARFALVGASVGCSIALQYAARDRSVDALVCLSPGLSYLGYDSAGDIHQVTGRRILLVATEDERDAPYTLQKRGAGVEVKIHPGAAHGTRMFGVVSGLEQDIAAFLKRAVGEPSLVPVCGSIKSNVYHALDSGWVREIAPTNLRYYSSPQEAEARGLRASRSPGPEKAPGADRKTATAGPERDRESEPAADDAALRKR